jgi:Domain of unknown function (DUF5666)
MTKPTHARLVRTLSALGLATALAVASAGVAAADSFHHHGRGGGDVASGRVSPFDYSQGGQGGYVMAVTPTSVTVESWNGTTTTYTLTPTTTYTENNQSVTATSLVVGDRVQIQSASGSPTTAAAVQIELAELFGIVSSVSGNTITIIGPEGFTRTILVSAQTTYTQDGQPSSLTAVTQGTRIEASGTIDANGTTLDALTIKVHSSFSNTRVVGVVTGFTASSVTVTTKSGASATYTFTTSTTFTEGHVATTQAALADGQRICITVSSAAPTTAVSVNIQLIRFFGVVSGLSTGGFVVTIHNNLSENVAVGATTVYTLHGQPSTLASVVNGVRVEVVGSLATGGTTVNAQSVKIFDMGIVPPTMPPSSNRQHNGDGGNGGNGGWGGRGGRH